MIISLVIRDSALNEQLTTLGEKVTFQVAGTVVELEQDGLVIPRSGVMTSDYIPPRRARIDIDTIQRQT